MRIIPRDKKEVSAIYPKSASNYVSRYEASKTIHDVIIPIKGKALKHPQQNKIKLENTNNI